MGHNCTIWNYVLYFRFVESSIAWSGLSQTGLDSWTRERIPAGIGWALDYRSEVLSHARMLLDWPVYRPVLKWSGNAVQLGQHQTENARDGPAYLRKLKINALLLFKHHWSWSDALHFVASRALFGQQNVLLRCTHAAPYEIHIIHVLFQTNARLQWNKRSPYVRPQLLVVAYNRW